MPISIALPIFPFTLQLIDYLLIVSPAPIESIRDLWPGVHDMLLRVFFLDQAI